VKHPDPHFIKAPDPGTPGKTPQIGGLAGESGESGDESKYRRVAKFLILIGADEAARILPHLEPGQIEAVSREIAAIRGITPEEGRKILGEFKSLLSSSYRFAGTSPGGPEAARRILYAAFGAERGEALLNKAIPFPKENPFNFLEDLAPEQGAILLKDESPAAAALILSRLSPSCSAAILAHFTPQHRTRTIRRIARQGAVSPEVLARITETLKEKALNFGGPARGGGDMPELNGKKALAEILRHGDYSLGEKILKDLAEQNPGLGKDLKEALLTPDDVVAMENTILQKKLGTMADRDIALLLKGKGREFTEKLLSNVSTQRAQEIREEGERMGPVPRRDVEEATRNFLDWLWQAGPEVLQTTKDVGV
jgi:flagellar motor switch protein FliG